MNASQKQIYDYSRTSTVGCTYIKVLLDTYE
jgi:hypothetical protein